MKRLRKSDNNRMFFGVCGGLGEYFNIDPTIIRILFVAFGLTGTFIVLYIICGLLMPSE